MLVTINNTQLKLKQIGKGLFSKVYENLDNTNEIYVFLKVTGSYDQTDMSKEAVALWATGDHTPQIEKLESDFYYSGQYYEVYRMPRYNKLQSKTTANDIANKLIKIYKSISNTMEFYRLCNESYYMACCKIIDAITEDNSIPETVKESITSIFDASTNYGEYMLEFQKRNLAVDNEGNLILLDIIFNPVAVRKARKF